MYYLQGTFYQEGSYISKGILAFNLVISFYYAFNSWFKYRIPVFFHRLTSFLALLTVYGVILIIDDETIYLHNLLSDKVSNYTYLKNIYTSLLPIFPFYVFGRRGMLTEKSFRLWAPIFLIMVTFLFYRQQDDMMVEALLSGSERVDFVNNVGYTFLAIIPMSMFYRNKPILQYIMLAFCVFYVIMGMKRGAIIIAALCIPVFIYMTVKNSSRKMRFRLCILGLFLLLLVGAIFYEYLNSNEFFQLRLEKTLDGYSSGRDIIYSTLWDFFISRTTPLQFFIGSGALSTLKIAGQYAHNDWLELAINQGMLGISFYLLYWYSFVKEWWILKKSNTDAYLIWGLVLIITLSKTFFSMSYGDMDFFTTMMLGYCLSRNDVATINCRNSSQM